MTKFNELKYVFFEYPLYSPDLATSDYYFIRKLKQFLRGKRFSYDEAITAIDGYFAELPKSHYRDGIKLLEDHWNTCIEVKGDYIEKIYIVFSYQKQYFFILSSQIFQPACMSYGIRKMQRNICFLQIVNTNYFSRSKEIYEQLLKVYKESSHSITPLNFGLVNLNVVVLDLKSIPAKDDQTPQPH